MKETEQKQAQSAKGLQAIVQPNFVPQLSFEGDADAVKLVVDAYRLQNGHIQHQSSIWRFLTKPINFHGLIRIAATARRDDTG